MAVHSFTDEQVDKARHALGLTRQKTAYRNYYSCAACPDWDDLVERGFATKRKSPISPDFLYELTREAAFYFLNAGEKLSPDLRFAVELNRREDPTHDSQ